MFGGISEGLLLGCGKPEFNVFITLRVTPAMEAGITDHVWEVEGTVRMFDAKEQQAEVC